MKSNQTTKPFYPYYMTGSNIVLSRYLVRTTDGYGNHYLCCYVLFKNKNNVSAIATAWVKWIHSPAVSSKSMEVDYSILSFTYFFEKQTDQYGYLKSINKRDILNRLS